MLFILAEKTFTHAYENSTTVDAGGLLALVLLVAGMLALPRRLTVIPMVLAACFIPVAQRIAFLTLDFTILRVVIMAGWLRLFMRGEFGKLSWKPIDTFMVLWGVCGTIIYVLQQQGSPDALVYKAGADLDSLGLYFLLRMLVRDWQDLYSLVRMLAYLAIPVFFSFALEYTTGRNAFSAFGGVPAVTLVRDGRLRCQGAFSHSILAGCFFASLIPVFFAQVRQRGSARFLAGFGLFTCFAIVYMCGSATPLMGVLAACVSISLFWARKYTRLIRWGTVGALVALHLVMKAPVWSLIQRVDVIGGSTGWHRYHLINAAVQHFGEWWLLGTRSTGHWGYFLFDVANQYILEGVRGGAITLVCFIGILALAYQGVGRMCREAGEDRKRLWMAWGLGGSLFVHCTCFIGVSYFGQMIVIWYLLLAVIGSLAPATRRAITSQPLERGRHVRGMRSAARASVVLSGDGA